MEVGRLFLFVDKTRYNSNYKHSDLKQVIPSNVIHSITSPATEEGKNTLPQSQKLGSNRYRVMEQGSILNTISPSGHFCHGYYITLVIFCQAKKKSHDSSPWFFKKLLTNTRMWGIILTKRLIGDGHFLGIVKKITVSGWVWSGYLFLL